MSGGRCKKFFYNRTPKGKAAFLVFVINVLETFAFYGSLSLIQSALSSHWSRDHGGGTDDSKSFTVFMVLLNTAGRVLYPVGGLIADVYLGRYRVIQIGLWFYWIGLAIILLSRAVGGKLDDYPQLQVALPIIAIVFVLIGSASVEPTIIPFGMDQIRQGASSDELSSYFFWYYFGRNFGYMLVTLFSLVVAITVPPIVLLGRSAYFITGIVAIMMVTIAMVLHHCLQHWYYKANRMENPIRSISNVLFFAATVKRQPPRYRRSFRYGEGKKSRMDLAKLEYDGIYSSEKVEDVKTFFRVLLVIISLGGDFITYGALSNVYSVELKFHQLRTQLTPSNLFVLIESGCVLLLLPFLNHFILPCCITDATMKRRIGAGMFFGFFSAFSALVIRLKITQILPLSALWYLFPIILFAVDDTLTRVTGLEFIYAQSPNSMKSILVGLYYFFFGIFTGIGTLTFDEMVQKYYIYYFVLPISAVGLVVYSVVAYLYRNRRRPTNDESEQDMENRCYAANVYSS